MVVNNMSQSIRQVARVYTESIRRKKKEETKIVRKGPNNQDARRKKMYNKLLIYIFLAN